LVEWENMETKILEKKHKRSRLGILLVIFFALCIISILVIRPAGPPIKSLDTLRESDIRQISLALEAYYDASGGKYPQSETLPNLIAPEVNLPADPGNGPCSSYQWISNMADPQKFCVWACLQDGKFYVANQKGVKISDKAPIDLNCGEETIKETFLIKGIPNEPEINVTVEDVSIPLDKNEAIKIYKAVVGEEPNCSFSYGGEKIECPIERIDNGWLIEVGIMGLNQRGFEINENNKTVNIYPGL
jgi:hypothetical protein